MADKRQIKRNIKQLQRLKTWQLLLILIIALLVSATFLRLNNIGMIERRTAVFEADKQGGDELIKERLFDLQRYSAEHMNADSGTIYLEQQYKRDLKKSVAHVNDSATSSQKTIEDRRYAYKECAKTFSYYSYPWTLCIGEKLSERLKATGGSSETSTGLPNPDLYRQEFASPLWSPDFAGFSLLFCGLLALIIVLRLISLAILKMLLHRHYSSI